MLLPCSRYPEVDHDRSSSCAAAPACFSGARGDCRGADAGADDGCHHRRVDGGAVSHRSGGGASRRRDRLGVERQRREQRLGGRGPRISARRAVTTYPATTGSGSPSCGWTSDGKQLVYVRGDSANRQGESPNPAQLQDGTDQAVFAVDRRRAAPHAASAPAADPPPSPRGTRVAWVSRGQIWSVDLAGADKPAQLVNRARQRRPASTWSPDGAMMAFSQQPRHAQLHRTLHDRRARAALSRSLARPRRQPGLVTGRRPHRVDAAGRRAAPAHVRAATDRRRTLVAARRRREDRTGARSLACRGRLRQRVSGSCRRQPAVLGRQRSPRVSMGEGRLAAPLLRAGGGRPRHAADAGRVRGGVHQPLSRSLARGLQLQSGRYRSPARLVGRCGRIGQASARSRRVRASSGSRS